MTKTLIRALAAAAVATAALLVSCQKKQDTTSSSGIATIACESGFENILSQEIDVFEYLYPNSSIIPYYVDEHAVIDSLLNLNVKLAVTTRTLTKEETEYLTAHKRRPRTFKIAVDAMALIVNPRNTMEEISLPEFKKILTGELTKWDEVWPNGPGEVSVVFDHQGSATVNWLRDSILGGAPFGPNVYAQQSNEEVFKAVAANRNAIGVISASWLGADMHSRELTREEQVAMLNKDTVPNDFTDQVRVLKVSGDGETLAVAPYQYYIYTGEYPLTRRVYLTTTSVNTTLSHGFYSFVTGWQGQKIIQGTGILPGIYRSRTNVEVR